MVNEWLPCSTLLFIIAPGPEFSLSTTNTYFSLRMLGTPLCNHDTLELSDILSLAVSKAACHSVYISGYMMDKLDGLRIES